ncbi:hypothetical protein PAECIP111893_03905 [Paenibacillus plantiphilus]|uniref:EamA-like transporter family protein n=1 Tax=Paenibacillus plantiphilus TaxID=2905650 RepID=A0ABM9CIF2_9BACL|nr:hypothetical protein PAECIP111893_03905 [Paenibacillus plantiphilus]
MLTARLTPIFLAVTRYFSLTANAWIVFFKGKAQPMYIALVRFLSLAGMVIIFFYSEIISIDSSL